MRVSRFPYAVHAALAEFFANLTLRQNLADHRDLGLLKILFRRTRFKRWSTYKKHRPNLIKIRLDPCLLAGRFPSLARSQETSMIAPNSANDFSAILSKTTLGGLGGFRINGCRLPCNLWICCACLCGNCRVSSSCFRSNQQKRAPGKPLWDSGVRDALHQAAQAEGCDFPGLGPHSFRRANVTWRQEVGASAIEASKIAGHSDLEMTGEYTFVSPERQNELTRRIQQKLVEAAGKNGKPTLLQPEVLMPGSPAASSMLDTLRRAQQP
jgi:hypothetical protein